MFLSGSWSCPAPWKRPPSPSTAPSSRCLLDTAWMEQLNKTVFNLCTLLIVTAGQKGRRGSPGSPWAVWLAQWTRHLYRQEQFTLHTCFLFKSVLKLEFWNIKSKFSFKHLIFLEHDMKRCVLPFFGQSVHTLFVGKLQSYYSEPNSIRHGSKKHNFCVVLAWKPFKLGG